jgi:hypothetical protein
VARVAVYPINRALLGEVLEICVYASNSMMRSVDCRCATSKFSWGIEVEGVSPLGEVVELTPAVGYLLPWTVVVSRMLDANTDAVIVR